MNFNFRPFSPTFGTKKEVTLTASAGTSQLVGQITGPVQVRVVNTDTIRACVVFGTLAQANAVSLANGVTIRGGETSVLTVHPNSDGSAVYWNVIGDATASKAFEVTLGQGS